MKKQRNIPLYSKRPIHHPCILALPTLAIRMQHVGLHVDSLRIVVESVVHNNENKKAVLSQR